MDSNFTTVLEIWWVSLCKTFKRTQWALYICPKRALQACPWNDDCPSDFRKRLSVSLFLLTSAAESSRNGRIFHSPFKSGWCLKEKGCLCIWAKIQRLLWVCVDGKRTEICLPVQHFQHLLYDSFFIILDWFYRAQGSTWCFSEHVEGIFLTLKSSHFPTGCVPPKQKQYCCEGLWMRWLVLLRHIAKCHTSMALLILSYKWVAPVTLHRVGVIIHLAAMWAAGRALPC